MSIAVRFACGHRATVSPTAAEVRCTCGETRVVHTAARAPRFVGACSGPYAETTAIEAVPVPLATAKPFVVTQEP